MATLGWIVFALGGGWAAFVATFIAFRGFSIEGAIAGFYAGIFCAAVWVIFIFWMSPISLTISTTN